MVSTSKPRPLATFRHDFRSSYEYFIHYQSGKILVLGKMVIQVFMVVFTIEPRMATIL